MAGDNGEANGADDVDKNKIEEIDEDMIKEMCMLNTQSKQVNGAL